MLRLIEIIPCSSYGEEDFYFRQCILAIPLSSPLGKWQGPSFEET